MCTSLWSFEAKSRVLWWHRELSRGRSPPRVDLSMTWFVIVENYTDPVLLVFEAMVLSALRKLEKRAVSVPVRCLQ